MKTVLLFFLAFSFSINSVLSQIKSHTRSSISAGMIESGKIRDLPRELYSEPFYFGVKYSGDLPFDSAFHANVYSTFQNELSNRGLILTDGTDAALKPSRSILLQYKRKKNDKVLLFLDFRDFVGIANSGSEHCRIKAKSLPELIEAFDHKRSEYQSDYFIRK